MTWNLRFLCQGPGEFMGPKAPSIEGKAFGSSLSSVCQRVPCLELPNLIPFVFWLGLSMLLEY